MTATILVVDDNPINLRLAADLLAMEGYAVLQAADADEALVVLAATIPDLILMDLAMPGMDGLTLTRLLKSQPRFRSVPIVALTASAMKGDDLRVRDAGCDAYITKPIDTRRFGPAIAALLAVKIGDGSS